MLRRAQNVRKDAQLAGYPIVLKIVLQNGIHSSINKFHHFAIATYLACS